MSTPLILVILFAAALLEAGGDALVRKGLHTTSAASRSVLFLIGALVLFVYGYVVNAPSWDFGRLLGVYVVFFFIVAQLIAWLAFGTAPNKTVLIGGFFIVLGGVILSFGNAAGNL
jgi:drug/metabolite transporter superfamily protein YnfA